MSVYRIIVADIPGWFLVDYQPEHAIESPSQFLPGWHNLRT